MRKRLRIRHLPAARERSRSSYFLMLLKPLREEVLEANLELVRRGLVLYTFGNVIGIDRGQGLVAIKPSGVPYEELTPEQILISHLPRKLADATLRPSSCLPP